MSAPVFAELLENLRANPAAHNRWKRLTDYPANNTAKMTASRLRKRYESEGFSFKVVQDRKGNCWAVGVLYKQPDVDGRVPVDGPGDEAR